MKEKTFENKVKSFLKEKGCWVLKTWSNGIQREGVPDLLVCCKGYFLGVELKAANGKPSQLQLWNIDKIRESGGIALVLYPDKFEDFKVVINNFIDGKFTNVPSDVYNDIFDENKIPYRVKKEV